MLRPSQWASLLVLAASAALVGCGPARGCLEGCGQSDAGNTHPQGPGTLETCPIQRACPHVSGLTAVSIQSLGQSGTAQLGNAIGTPLGPAVSWIVVPDQPGASPRIGVALPAQNQVIALDATSALTDPRVAPVVFSRSNEIDLLPAPFDQVIPIPLDTLKAGAPVPLTLQPLAGSVPAASGTGQALAALVDPGPELAFFDSTLGDPLLSIALGSATTPETLALAPTCNGLLASWDSHVEAFTTIGDRVGPVVDTGIEHPHVVWDGAELVVSGDKGVVELDSKGTQRSHSSLPIGIAVGTDDGLLTISNQGSSSEAVVRDRASGAITKSLGQTSRQLLPEEVVVEPRVVYFLQASGSSLLWLGVTCGA